MLLFIASALFLLPPFGIISIHLMLLFISVDWDAFAASVGFQYISCYCLSHLLHELFLSVMPFQYISCYCLSSPPLPVLHSLFHFNTSHVTVYLINLWFCLVTKIAMHPCSIFQYISCYCLSGLLQKDSALSRTFQYISCYCLSNELTPFYIFLRI